MKPARQRRRQPFPVLPTAPLPGSFNIDLTRTLGPLAGERLTLSLGWLCYGGPRVFFQAGMPSAKLTIGSFCSTGNDCKNFVGGASRHFQDFATTSPLTMFFRPITGDGRSAALQGDLSVTNAADMLIGENVTILAGVRVSHGAIIGAHTLVIRYVLPHAVVGGSPARLIRFRFGDDHVRRFLRSRLSASSGRRFDHNCEKRKDLSRAGQFALAGDWAEGRSRLFYSNQRSGNVEIGDCERYRCRC